MSGVLRVALVDDQALMRAGFRALLDAEEGIEVVGEAADGESSASPCATTSMAWSRSAGSVSLRRKPLAPARSASKTYSSRP